MGCGGQERRTENKIAEKGEEGMRGATDGGGERSKRCQKGEKGTQKGQVNTA